VSASVIGLFRILLGLAAVSIFAIGFAVVFSWWHGLGGGGSEEIMAIYAVAIVIAALLFLIGHALRIRSDAYYIIAGGIVFLGVDYIVWQRLGLMPSVKFSRGGFVPAGILGVFLGPVYRIIAVRVPPVFQRR
jgi:hypothetical protein